MESTILAGKHESVPARRSLKFVFAHHAPHHYPEGVPAYFDALSGHRSRYIYGHPNAVRVGLHDALDGFALVAALSALRAELLALAARGRAHRLRLPASDHVLP